jgi:hypothetical protein
MMLGLARERYRTFKYLAGFVREWMRLSLTDEYLSELETLFMSDPDAAAVVSGTSSLRKLTSPTWLHKRGVKSGRYSMSFGGVN